MPCVDECVFLQLARRLLIALKHAGGEEVSVRSEELWVGFQTFHKSVQTDKAGPEAYCISQEFGVP